MTLKRKKVQHPAMDKVLVLISFVVQNVAFHAIWDDVSTQLGQIQQEPEQEQQLRLSLSSFASISPPPWLMSYFLGKGLILITGTWMICHVFSILYSAFTQKACSSNSTDSGAGTQKRSEKQEHDNFPDLHSCVSFANSPAKLRTKALATNNTLKRRPSLITSSMREIWTRRSMKGGLAIVNAQADSTRTSTVTSQKSSSIRPAEEMRSKMFSTRTSNRRLSFRVRSSSNRSILKARRTKNEWDSNDYNGKTITKAKATANAIDFEQQNLCGYL